MPTLSLLRLAVFCFSFFLLSLFVFLHLSGNVQRRFRTYTCMYYLRYRIVWNTDSGGQ